MEEDKLRLSVVFGNLPLAFERKAFVLLRDVRKLALDGAHVAPNDIESCDGFNERVCLGEQDPLHLGRDLLVLKVHLHHPYAILRISRIAAR